MFNKDFFANILKKINDEYPSMTEFAKQASLDRSYISKYINKKLSNPPTPKILSGISNASKGITTYDELMKICGYINVGSLSDIELSNNEMNILTKMLLDYKEFLSKEHSFEKFDDYKYVANLTKDSREKIIIAFRRNFLDLILNKNTTDDTFEFVAEDDAMFPLLDIGDIAIVQKQNFILDGATHLIKLNNKNTIRKIVLSEDKTYYTLIAMNACYKNLNIKITDINQITILGKIIKTENRSAFK